MGHDQAEVLVRGEDRMLVAYGKGGRLVAVAGMHMGAAVMRYRAQLVRTTTMSEVLSP